MKLALTCIFVFGSLATACAGPTTTSSLREDIPGKTYAIYASLSKAPSAADPDAYRVMAVGKVVLDPKSVQFCLSTLEKCTTDLTQPKIEGVAQKIDGLDVFVTKSFVKILNNTQITIMAKDMNGIAQIQTIKITEPSITPATGATTVVPPATVTAGDLVPET